MDTRRLVGFAILALAALIFVAVVWIVATSRKRDKARERRAFDRQASRKASKRKDDA